MKFKKLIVVMAIATLIISFGLATVSATTDVKNERENNEICIESKEKKVSSYKIVWSANGGKIGTKKSTITYVKKGSKINKLAKSPKRSGFAFKGWYTKKSGGTKITKSTKPKKSATLYAQWTRKGITSTNSKLVGKWQCNHTRTSLWGYKYAMNYRSVSYYYFYADGRFTHYSRHDTYLSKYEGKYSVSNGKVHFKERKLYYFFPHRIDDINFENLGDPKYKYELGSSESDMISVYKLGSDKEGNYLQIAHQTYMPNGNTVITGENDAYRYEKL